MRRSWIAAALTAAWISSATLPCSVAFGQFYQARTPQAAPVLERNSVGQQQPNGGSRRFVVSPRGNPSTAPAPAPNPTPPPADPPADSRPGRDRDHHHHHHRRGNDWWQIGYPWFWGGIYTPAFPVYSTFDFVPTVTVDPASIDPQPVQPPGPAPAPGADPKAKQKIASAEQKAKAGRFLNFGDAQFAKAKYLAAMERYKTAIEIAPDVAEAYLRQGFAQMAMGQHGNAARSFRRGLNVRGDWAGAPLRLNDLYGNAGPAKDAHLEGLAKAVEANPLDSDLLFVLGMALHFDGQADRASVFFERAAQLGGNDDRLLSGFLKPKPAGAADPGGGKLVF